MDQTPTIGAIGKKRNILQPTLKGRDVVPKALDHARAMIGFAKAKRRVMELGWPAFSTRYASSSTAYTKYLDLDQYLRRDLRRAHEVARYLRSSKAEGSVIDLGSGLGLFPFCCEQLGLICRGVEPRVDQWDYSEMFQESAHLLGVQTLDHHIKPLEAIPVPKEWGPIAAVTANQIQFNKTGRGDDANEVLASERFGVDEWDYLLRDLYRQAQMSTVFVKLSFNKPASWEASYTDNLRSYFEGLGGICRGSVVLMPALRYR